MWSKSSRPNIHSSSSGISVFISISNWLFAAVTGFTFEESLELWGEIDCGDAGLSLLLEEGEVEAP